MQANCLVCGSITCCSHRRLVPPKHQRETSKEELQSAVRRMMRFGADRTRMDGKEEFNYFGHKIWRLTWMTVSPERVDGGGLLVTSDYARYCRVVARLRALRRSTEHRKATA